MSREEDKRVAEITGISLSNPIGVSHFTENLAADYDVLDWARSEFGFTNRNNFVEALQEIVSRRTETDFKVHQNWLMWFYEVGDYSRALLELDRKGLLK